MAAIIGDSWSGARGTVAPPVRSVGDELVRGRDVEQLIDLQPEGSGRAPVATTAASLLGLAAGGLGTSALVQDGPAPTRLIWWLLLGAFLAAAAAVLAMPETAQARPGALATLRLRVAVPRQARGTFVMAPPWPTARPSPRWQRAA